MRTRQTASSVPTNAPTERATLFSNTAPNVTVFARDWRPQRSVRANSSWNGAILDARYMANEDATYSVKPESTAVGRSEFQSGVAIHPRRRRTSDLRPTGQHRADHGSIASRDARVVAGISHAFSEIRSDLQSQTAQLTLRLSPIPRGPVRFT
jgi:hypothetical protein